MNVSDLSIPVRVDARVAHERLDVLLSLPRVVQRLIPERLAFWWILRGLKVTI